MRSQQNRKIMIAGILDQSANTVSEDQDLENETPDVEMANFV
jgi:hypothetical protein